MIDIGAIASATSSLKAAGDIAHAMLKLRDVAQVQEKTVELTAQIIAAHQSALQAQGAQATLIARVDELEKQVVEFENWEAQKQRYRLEQIEPAGFAYALKPGMDDGEPPHKVCANCYEHRRRSILQRKDTRGELFLFCPSCKMEFQVYG